MGFDNDCILNIQSLAGEYFCPVCHLLVYPNEALQAQCTHLYCKPCLTYVVSTTHACPYDGYRVTEADCKPLLESNKALADTIRQIQVHCLYYRTGCTWQGTLSDCISHCSTCSFGESPVLCNKCSVQIVHRQVQEHAQSCPGVQSLGQQTGTVQDTTSTGAGTTAEQSQTATQTGISASEAQTSQTSASLVSGQDANQAANSAAQAAMPTPQQWQQYQQQYQQYYQQYPGYDPYQQNYQYYHQYQQGAQQYPQQPMQGYPPQPYGQAQPQVYAQAPAPAPAPAQPQLQSQQQVQPLAQPQLQQPPVHSQTAQPQPAANAAPQTQLVGKAQPQMQAQGQAQPQMKAQGQAQPQMQAQGQAQPQMQAQGQAQPQMQAQGQAQPQMQAQSHAQPQMQAQSHAHSSQALSYNQSQPYAQPQPITQPMQFPQYQQTPQVQHPHGQPYPQSQTAQNYLYPHPQSQVQSQPYSQPTLQAPAFPPSQQNQPINPGVQLQTQNAVSGYQSYPQSQPRPQGQGGAAHPMHVPGAQAQPQYAAQMQGKLPAQPNQMHPQPYSNIHNQQLPAVSSAQVQPPSGPTAPQPPVFPHSQQPGYPFQHRPGMQAAQQASPTQHYGQQQSFSGHGAYMQPQSQPPMAVHSHAQGPPQMMYQSQQNYAPGHGAQHNMAQNYAARPVAHAGMGQVRPPQVNQTYPFKASNQVSASSEQQTGHLQQPSRTAVGEKQVLDKSMHDKNNPNKETRNLFGGSSAGVLLDDVKRKAESAFDSGFDGNDSKLPGMGSKSLESDAPKVVLEPSSGSKSAKNGAENLKDVRKKVEAQDSKHTAKSGAPNMPQSNLIPQVHGTNAFPSVDQGRNQLQPMLHGPAAQLMPGAVSMPQSTPHPYNSQQSTLGHPPVQSRQTGPGQAPSRPPFNAAENPQPSSLKQPPGPVPQENASEGVLAPGSAGPFPRPGNMGYHQGNMPPYQAGQPQNPPGEPFGGSSFAAQQPGAFDSHVGVRERERADFEQRPPYPMENEKFPVQRPGYFDGRKPESLPHGSYDRAAYGPVQPGAMKNVGPPAHDSMSAPGMKDERGKPFPEKHPRHFPHRDFDDDLRTFPKPSHFEAGLSSKYGTQFPSSGALDHGPHVFAGDGPSRPFGKAIGLDRDPGLKLDSAVGPGRRFLPPFHPNDVGERGRPGFPDDNVGRGNFGHRADFSGPAPGPGFGRSRMDGLPPRSPGRDFPGLPSRTFDGFGDGGNGFPAEPFGKSIHDSRFPVPLNHLQRGEIDVPGNLRVGGPLNQDMFPNHLRTDPVGPRDMHMGEARMVHQRFGFESGFYPEEMDPFDDPRKWKPMGIMCRICKVECGTLEGLDLHSQSREHQRKARDMVLSIKQQSKKKQKISKDQASFEGRDGGRPRNSSFQGQRNKR